MPGASQVTISTRKTHRKRLNCVVRFRQSRNRESNEKCRRESGQENDEINNSAEPEFYEALDPALAIDASNRQEDLKSERGLFRTERYKPEA